MTIREIDFQLIQGKVENKVFKFTNSDGSIYSLTGSTAKCKLFISLVTPTEITCTINTVLGTITIPFTALLTATLGTYEYIIEETKSTTEVIPLVKGNITIILYTPFSETIEAYLRSELPGNLTLSEDFRNQKIMYWRKILQGAFGISDGDLNVESAWPILVNALIAKLVVYDAMELATRGSFIQFLGGSYDETTTIGGGGVKSVETGPTKVEYFDTAAAAKSALSAPAGGVSVFDILKGSLCGLASYLQVKLPMCDSFIVPIPPQFYQNPDWEGVELEAY